MTACPTSAPTNTPVVSDGSGARRGPTASASPSASITLTFAGTARAANGGAIARNAAIRTPASIVVSTRETGSVSAMGSMSAPDERGDAGEQVVRERHELGDHPVPRHDERDPDRDGLRDEAERDLLDLGHRLDERDGEPDHEGRDEDR